MIFENLQVFRKTVYESLGRARDAVFELVDAVLTSPSESLFVSLSLSPVFRRQWPSVYAAVQDSRIPRTKLMKHYLAQISSEEQPLLAGDHTAWARPAAVTLQDRTFEHDPMSGNPTLLLLR